MTTKNNTDKATARITVEKLARPEHQGDWHDKPLRWQVNGPEIQKFSTKREALTWAKIRRHASSLQDATNDFLHAL